MLQFFMLFGMRLLCPDTIHVFFERSGGKQRKKKPPHPFRQRKKARPNPTEHNSASTTLVHAPNSHISTPSRLLYMSEPLWHKHHELRFTQSHKKTYIRIQYRIPSCIPHHKEHPQNTMPFTYLHYLRRFNIFTHTHCTCCDHGSEFLHEGVINRLEELLNRERRGRKRDRIRKFVRSRNFIRPSNFVKSFVKSLRRKKKGKGPRRERPDRKRDWSQRFIGFLRRKKSGEVEIPLQARGADGA